MSRKRIIHGRKDGVIVEIFTAHTEDMPDQEVCIMAVVIMVGTACTHIEYILYITVLYHFITAICQERECF